MTDSLLLNNSIQLLENGVPSGDPRCPGALFQLYPGYDFGAPQPTTNIIASLLLDGERPTGERFSNRTFIIPVMITGTSRDNLAAAREVLLSTVNQNTWSMLWLREGGLNVIYDCFRAQASQLVYDIKADRANIGVVTLTIPALPFGRSDTAEVLTFAGFGAGGVASTINPVTLDSYTSVSGTNWSPQNGGSISGSCAHYSDPGTGAAAVYTTTLAGTDITGRVSLSHYVGIATKQSYWGYGFDPGNISVGYAINDNGGHTLNIGTAFYLNESYNLVAPSWYAVSVPIPQGHAGFNYADVTSVVVTITNFQGYSLKSTDVFLDELSAVPNTVARPVISNRGAVYQLTGIKGTAHAPVSFQAAQTGPYIEIGPIYPAIFSQGTVEIPCVPAYATAMTGAVLNLTGSNVFAKISQVPQVGNGTTETLFQARYDQDNHFMLYVSGGGFVARLRQAGVNTNHAIDTYSSVYGPYWRIREASGTVYFDTSTDSVTWTNQWSSAHTLSTKIQVMRVWFQCGYYGTEVSPQPLLVGGINSL